MADSVSLFAYAFDTVPYPNEFNVLRLTQIAGDYKDSFYPGSCLSED